MPKRKLSDDRLRDLVRSRLTKGDAFRLDAKEYQCKQEAVARKLAGMPRAAIMNKYPELTYDIR